MYCNWPLTLYYDGACPLCAREIAMLRTRSSADTLILVDISHEDFTPETLGLTLDQLAARLHGRFASGEWVTGLDATLWSWRAAGLGHWVAPLTWRPLRPLLSFLYRFFCRVRPHLAWLPHPEGAHRCRSEESKCHIR
jgi:predicted DCC family thiol-disulfide oxidoreductase YuxK